MRHAYLKIGLFLLFLAAPVGSILLLGSVDSFGREQPDFPRVGALNSALARTQLGDAVLERTAVMKGAVQLHDWIGLRVVGFIISPVAISGKDGWLFYRPELHDGACIDLQNVTDQLQRLRALIDMAQASGLDLRVSLAPNKSTIYPDQLHPYFRGYWRCNAKDVAGVRERLKQHAPFVIDHAVPLLAERVRNPDASLYYLADTHWTPYGGTIALRQLLTTIYPTLDIPAPRLTDGAATQEMDLASALQLPLEKQASEVAPLPRDVLDQLNRNSAAVRTIISHDSFYDRISSQVHAAFPNAMVFRGTKDAGWMRAQVAVADRVIVNLVERELVRSITDGALDWKANIPSAIIARNRQVAERCGSFAAVAAGVADSPVDIRNKTDMAVAVREVEPRRLPCVRISLVAHATTTVTVAVPDSSGALLPEQVVKVRVEAGTQTVALVLPRQASGAHIGLGVTGLGEAATLSRIEVGEVARPRLAIAGQDGSDGSLQP
jgi:hypothetical protein